MDINMDEIDQEYLVLPLPKNTVDNFEHNIKVIFQYHCKQKKTSKYYYIYKHAIYLGKAINE